MLLQKQSQYINLTLENLIEKTNIKQGTMQNCSQKTRLPGFSGEWNSSRLGDLLSVMSGKDWKM